MDTSSIKDGEPFLLLLGVHSDRVRHAAAKKEFMLLSGPGRGGNFQLKQQKSFYSQLGITILLQNCFITLRTYGDVRGQTSAWMGGCGAWSNFVILKTSCNYCAQAEKLPYQFVRIVYYWLGAR